MVSWQLEYVLLSSELEVLCVQIEARLTISTAFCIMLQQAFQDWVKNITLAWEDTLVCTQ